MSYPCPVCGYSELPDPPVDMSYEICPSCGTEFGYSDFRRSHEELMVAWVRTGPAWFASWMPPPPNWNPRRQLLAYWVPQARLVTSRLHMEGSQTIEVTEQNQITLTVSRDTVSEPVAA